jgi:undecaprenyl-diphosphatase
MDLGNLFIPAFLGCIQGITEFLPVSSTAHLIIAESYFRMDPADYGLSFDMFTNIGTVAAVCLYFRKDFTKLLRHFRLPARGRPFREEERWPWLLIAATLPALVVGAATEKYLDSELRTLPVIAASLIAIGLLMLLAEQRLHTRKERGNRAETAGFTFPYLAMGGAQVLALIPGVSRSGVTMAGGILSGLDRVQAARFSFLMSVPITIAAIMKRMWTFGQDIAASGIRPDVAASYMIALLFAALAGFFTIHYLLRFLRSAGFAPFAYYRFLLAAVLIFFS